MTLEEFFDEIIRLEDLEKNDITVEFRFDTEDCSFALFKQVNCFFHNRLEVCTYNGWLTSKKVRKKICKKAKKLLKKAAKLDEPGRPPHAC